MTILVKKRVFAEYISVDIDSLEMTRPAKQWRGSKWRRRVVSQSERFDAYELDTGARLGDLD